MVRLVLVVMVAAATACGPGADEGAGAVASAPPRGQVEGEVVVQAAASLTTAFTDVGAAFEGANPGVEVSFNFAGSQTLASQILHGAPVDVFASANTTQMDRIATDDLLTGAPTTFGRNQLAIAVQAGNPSSIAGLADLVADDVTVVLAAPGVPAGDAAVTALRQAGVVLAPASLEADVRGVLAKVVLGEADAGIVFTTDLRAAGDSVEGIEIPASVNVTTRYPIAIVDDAPNPVGAAAFVDFVLSDPAQQILRDHGFQPPSGPR